ncbi:MAG: hypothetical protein ABI456_18055 [Ktedonobacteraceae bacterium]
MYGVVRPNCRRSTVSRWHMLELGDCLATRVSFRLAILLDGDTEHMRAILSSRWWFLFNRRSITH